MYKDILSRLTNGIDLNAEEVSEIISDIREDKLTEGQISGFLAALAMTPIRFCLEEPKSIEEIGPTVTKYAPKVGEDSVEILMECGYTKKEIDKMIADGIVACHK